MNWKMFKELPFGKKVQWIFQYYGLTMAVVAGVIVVVVAFVQTLLGPQEHCAINVMILDANCSSDESIFFAEELGELFHDTCKVTSYLEEEGVQRQAFVVRLASEKLDLIIAPEDEMNQMLENDYLEYMQLLDPESNYYQVTRGGASSEEARYYIGKAVRNMNGDHIEEARMYFADPR